MQLNFILNLNEFQIEQKQNKHSISWQCNEWTEWNGGFDDRKTKKKQYLASGDMWCELLFY